MKITYQATIHVFLIIMSVTRLISIYRVTVGVVLIFSLVQIIPWSVIIAKESQERTLHKTAAVCSTILSGAFTILAYSLYFTINKEVGLLRAAGAMDLFLLIGFLWDIHTASMHPLSRSNLVISFIYSMVCFLVNAVSCVILLYHSRGKLVDPESSIHNQDTPLIDGKL